MESSQIEEILSSSIGEEEKHVSFERNESTSENLKAIKEFIENEEKKIEEIDSSNAVNTKENADINQQVIDGNYKVASDVMDMILLSDSQTNSSQDIESIHPEHQSTSIQKGSILSSKDKGNGSMSLSIGSKVEVKDFEEDWYCAEIVEVDYEDMEVLIHFQVDWKKPDEWINVGSPRLRPFTGTITKPPIKTVTIKDEPMDESIEEPSVKVEPTAIKMEDKANEFEVGERCLARWRDNRRFVATIHKVLGDGTYEVVFDDGDHWTCKTSRLSKMKSGIADSLKIDTSLQSTSVGSPSPIASGATNAPDTSPLTPAFHTHLFDPARDYLGSKSERREMKRKLNIKEIFNIDQRKYKVPKIEKPKVPAARKQNVKKVPVVKLPKVKLEKVDYGGALKQKIKAGVPDAVASIIGSINKEDSSSSTVQGAKKGLYLNNELNECVSELVKMDNVDEDSEYNVIEEIRPFGGVVDPHCETLDDEEEELKSEGDPVSEEDVVLENFDSQDVQAHAQVLDNIKRAILKIEKGLDDEPATLKIERVTPATPQIQEIKEKTDSEVPKVETELSKTENDQELINLEDIGTLPIHDNVGDISMENLDNEELCLQNDNNVPIETSKKSNKDLATVKKSRKLKLLKRRKAHLDMERVKLELARMKRKYEKMKREMYDKIQGRELVPAPESHLQPHEWCCKWVNGQPVGRVSEIENTPQLGLDTKPALPRRSVEVYDRRIPPGWTKHMVRRSAGHSAGKWHVVLVSPEECGSRKFHTKGDMRQFLTSNADPALLPYHDALMDFGVHLKVSRRMGWIQNTPDGIAEGPDTILPAGSSSVHSPLLKRKKINLKKRNLIMKEKKRGLMKRGKKRRPIKIKLQKGLHTYNSKIVGDEYSSDVQVDPTENIFEQNLMPLEDGYVYVGSLKVQIIENLLRCPAEGCFKNFRTKTLLQMHIKHYHRELTAQLGRTPKVLDLAYARTIDTDSPQHERKVLKVKIHRPQKREEQTIQMSEALEIMDPSMTPSRLEDMPKIPRSLDSPKLRLALSNKPTRGPRVLLPVRRPEPEPEQTPSDSNDDYEQMETVTEVPMIDNELDFETAISTHTVTKPPEKKKKGDKKKSFASFSKNISEDEEMFALVSDDFDTMSSFPRSGTPDSKVDSKMAAGQMSSESNEEQKDHMYTYTETGERIKIEHMKREEIINCHCGVREEDGLMVQCELCLCWQHALCHNIQRETEVPEKYTCSICLNPRRGRRSQRFVHDQDRVYEGALAGAAPVERLRRAHELAANLLLLRDALHALRVKGYVASKKNHPKLYLWASEWDDTAAECSSERVRCEYSDMQVIVNGVGKENRPLRDDPDVPSTTLDDGERAGRDAFGAQCLLSGLLASPGGASLDLALNSSEFDRIANSVQESGWSGAAPQPEAAIENGACRERLLRHARRALARLDLALTYIDAHVTELESQEPTFGEDYETAESYPRTKQTIQMLMRDLDTMEELGVIT